MKRGMIRGLALALCLLLIVAPMAMADTKAAKKVTIQLVNPGPIVAGFSGQVTVSQMSDGTAVPTDIVFSIPKSQRKIATIDASTGVVTAKAAGKVTVTAKSPSLGKGKNGMCKVTVKANSISWKIQKTEGLSPKKLYRSGGSVKCEIWAYNSQFKHGLSYIFPRDGGQMTLGLVDTNDGTVLGTATLGTKYTFKGRIGYKKSKVIKATFNGVPDGLDLTSNRYQLAWPDIQNVMAYGYKGIESETKALLK